MDSRISSSRIGIRDSEFFLVLGTENYAQSIRDPANSEHHLLVEQIAYAKGLGKPVAVLLETGLSSESEGIIREALKGMEIIDVIGFEPGNDESLKLAVTQIKATIDKHGDNESEVL